MSDFRINIDSHLNLQPAEQKLQEFLNKYKNKTLDLNIGIDPKSFNTSNLSKQIQGQIGNAGINAGKAFVSNMAVGISKSNIDDVLNKLSNNNISKNIITSAEQRLNQIVEAGTTIKRIKPEFLNGKLVSLEIKGIDKGENAVTILERLNAKKNEWNQKTIFDINLDKVNSKATETTQKLLTLEEIQARLHKASGNVGALEATFGNVGKFTGDFNSINASIQKAFSMINNGASANEMNVALAEIEAKIKTISASTRQWNKETKAQDAVTANYKNQMAEAQKFADKQRVLQAHMEEFRQKYATLFDPKSSNYSESIVSSFNKISNAINNISSMTDARVADRLFKGLSASAKQASAEIKTSTNSITQDIAKIQGKSDLGLARIGALSSNAESQKSLLGDQGYATVTQHINMATQAQQRLNAELNSANPNFGRITQELKVMEGSINKATSAMTRLTAPASAIKQQNVLNSFLNWGKQNSKAVKAGGVQYNDLVGRLSGGTLSEGQLADITQGIKNFKNEMQLSGNVGKLWTQELGRGFKQIAQFAGTYGLIHRIPMLLKRMASEVLKVDTAMTELRKVSDASDSQLDSYFTKATNSAKELGATISDVISSTADFSRLGYNLFDASKLSEVATLYKNVGDGISIDDASSSIVSTMKAFNIEATNAISIVDKFNEVGNNFAISSGGIGDALSRSASSLAVAGNSLDESIALITAGKQHCLRFMETYFLEHI